MVLWSAFREVPSRKCVGLLRANRPATKDPGRSCHSVAYRPNRGCGLASSEWIVGHSYKARIDPAARLLYRNWPETAIYRPICLDRSFQHKRLRIKQIGRYIGV